MLAVFSDLVLLAPIKLFGCQGRTGVQTFDASVTSHFLNLHQKGFSDASPRGFGRHITCSQFVLRNYETSQTNDVAVALRKETYLIFGIGNDQFQSSLSDR